MSADKPAARPAEDPDVYHPRAAVGGSTLCRRDWHDAARDRPVPVRVFLPDTRLPRPLVVFSPGLGARAEDYDYLLQYWAGAGFVVAHVTHPGLDDALWRATDRPWPALLEALDEPRHRLDRPRDVRFALDQLAGDAELAGRIDWQRIAATGHSYGSFTALVLAGLRFELPGQGVQTLPDARIRCVIGISTQGEGMFGLHGGSWRPIAVPVLCLTGTRDKGLKSKRTEERRVAFDRIPATDQFLVVLRRANHYAFSAGEGIGLRPPPREPEHHSDTQAITTAFLAGYLDADRAARRWLRDAAATFTAGRARVESRAVSVSEQQI